MIFMFFIFNSILDFEPKILAKAREKYMSDQGIKSYHNLLVEHRSWFVNFYERK
jgi:hypothetical protein